MTLRDQFLLSPDETLSDLAFAAERRFVEGEELLFAGHLAGAVYLLGLACEMWLKLACFRARGGRPSDTVQGLRGPARVWMSTSYPIIARESDHSLHFWAEYLIRWRAREAIPLRRELVGMLRHTVVNRVFWDWKIEMRYRAALISERHAARVYNDVTRLRMERDNLWR